MHRIGEIDGGGALRQLNQLALRGESEDPVLVHRHPGMLEQLFGALGMVEDLDQVIDPRDVHFPFRLAFLVRPVRREPALSLLMHLPVADLDFDPHLRIVDDGGVQALVAVALGCRNVVLEAARNHRPAAVDQPQRAIAFADILHDDSEGHHIGQLLEADVPLGHLLPDRVGVLLTAGDLGFETIVGEVQLQPKADAIDEIAALLRQLFQSPGDRGEGVGLELPERERLHLGHHLVHADPLGERGIDIHRLAGDSPALVLGRDVMERAHVVQPIGELHQQHPDVVAEREEELAEVLGGALVLGLGFDLGKLGHAVDQARDVLAEMLLDLFRRGECVLNRIMEDRGDDRLVVELQVGEDARDLYRVAEVRVAGRADLRTVRLHRENVGAVDQPLVRVGIVGANLLDQFVLSQHASKMGRCGAFVQARKAGAGPRRGNAAPREDLLGSEG